MIFLLQRYSNVKEFGGSTQGLLFTKDPFAFFCHTLEDESQTVKVKGETRIPAGLYELKIRKEDTPLTVKHRKAYSQIGWFKNNPGWFHIEITNIQGFSGVYVHAGNKESHTEGCLLLGRNIGNNTLAPAELQNSIIEVSRFYEIVYPILNGNHKCFIEIRDEKHLI